MQKIDPRHATSVRYVVVLVTFLAAFLLYLHRFCFSYMQRYLKEDLQITDDQIAYCFSAFFFAYALAQVPSGWMSDRFGARVMLTFYVLVWSLFTGLMGFATGFVMLLAVRIAAALGQAGAYPTSAGLLRNWMPLNRRGTANGIVAFGGRLGGGLASILTVLAVVAFVPVSVPSKLTTGDLLDVHLLCFRMVEGSEAATQFRREHEFEETSRDRLAKRVYAEMPAEVQQSAHRIAEEYVRAREKAIATDSNMKVDPRQPVLSRTLGLQPVSGEEAERFVQSLNALLTGPVLSRQEEWGADFEETPKEREATGLHAQTESLTIEEHLRLNRLLLEAIFPESLKKIYVHGWRPVVVLYGSLGLFVAGLFWFCFRDRPREHPWSNPAEAELIERGQLPRNGTAAQKVGRVPLGHIVRSRSLWLMCLNQWGGNVGWVFLVTWLPRYLLEVHEVPYVQRGWLAAFPLWVGWGGMLAGGWLTDRVVQRYGLRWRILPIVVSRTLAMTAYLFCLLHPSAVMVTVIFAVVAFSNDLNNPSSWAYKQDVGGAYVASIHGWANMWGNLGATVSPVLLQFVIKSHGWDAAFLTCAGAFAIAALAALGVDARIPIVPEEEGREEASLE